jgi:hypothetical protein
MKYPPRPIAITLLLLAGAAGACSSGGGGDLSDGGGGDLVYEVAVMLPDGCPPATGNEKGVGLPCTQGGNECKAVSSNLQCSCDPLFGAQLVGIPCLCTLVNLAQSVPDGGTPCDNIPAGFCGSAATCCPYMTVGYFCSPDICLADGICPDVSGGR